MIAKTAFVENTAEQRLIDFLEENGGTQTTAQIQTSLGISPMNLHPLISSLEQQGKIKYKSKKLSLIKQAKAKETNFCAKCKTPDIPSEELKRNGQLCDDCHTKIMQAPLALDDFDLQPDEMTFKQFVILAKEKTGIKSDRAVGKWLEKGLIPFETTTRRDEAGNLNNLRVFKVTDVNKFFDEKKSGKKSGQVDKLPKEEMQPTEQMQTSTFSPENFFNLMNEFAMQMQRPKSVLMELSGKVFISLDELAQFSGIAKARLEPEIKLALEKGTLHHFTGERGKSVYKCVELDLIIENLPPTPKQIAPPPETRKTKSNGQNKKTD